MFKAAARTFEVGGRTGDESFNDGNPVEQVLEPNQTTLSYFESESGLDRLCLITSHTLTHTFGLYRKICDVVACATGLRSDQIVAMSSHNHCSVRLSREPLSAFYGEADRIRPVELTPSGQVFFQRLEQASVGLVESAVPVSVSWAVGKERRIHYNRKGRRADGTTYFMREEDRLLLGRDFNGDIDDDAPVVVLRDERGEPILALLHFNAHPATAFHPEHPIIFGEYAQVAADSVGRHLGRKRRVPVAFLQGCAGDINSKGLLTGDVARARAQGAYLAESYRKALQSLNPSSDGTFAFVRRVARVPFRRFPSLEKLERDRAEIDRFIRRARAGDEDTLTCAGLNFSPRLSPAWRARLVQPLQKWHRYARKLRERGEAEKAPSFLEMECCVIRLGDVVIAGMPGEPFMGVARQVRRQSNAKLTVACGYTNVSFGYLPDGPNCGDREYMSSFYRYTHRPDYRKPAGDVLANTASMAANSLLER
jgi:hypothetical protein